MREKWKKGIRAAEMTQQVKVKKSMERTDSMELSLDTYKHHGI